MKIIPMLVLFVLGSNCAVAAVFGDHISLGGQGGAGSHPLSSEKEPIPEYLQTVVSCKLGKPHRQYPECRCGERVQILTEAEISFENAADFHVRMGQTRRGRAIAIYYHCLFCSQCPDGVRTLSNCSRMADTQCTTSCIRPTDIFDKGRKACVPDPRLETQTRKSTVDTDSPHVTETREDEEGTSKPLSLQLSDNSTPKVSSAKSTFLADDTYLLIVGWALVIAVVIVLIVNVFICRYLYHRKKRDQEKETILPKTTSTASMTTAWTSTAPTAV